MRISTYLDEGKCWMLDAGYWILDAGCWMLDAGCWMLDSKPLTTLLAYAEATADKKVSLDKIM